MNKREQQKLKKQQKQQEAQKKQQTQKLMMKVGMYVVAPLFLLLVLFNFFAQGPTYSPIEIAENDHIRGNPQTPVTITVYADFECPACARENQLMARAWPSIQDKAHMVFRHYPVTVTHPSAWEASLYAEAASKQGMFWEMHDYLFANQAIWASSPNPLQEFESYALELNLDMEQLQLDIESDEVIAKVRNDQRGGNQSGVRSTPTLFINGELVAASTVTRLVDLVDSAFEEANGS